MLGLVFINHVSMYLSNLGFNYNNVFGFILLIIFIIQFITGLLLSIYYSSYYLISFNSIFYITFNVSFGWLIRLLHIIGSILFIFFIYFHFLRSFWYIISFNCLFSSFYFIYLSGIIILFLSLAISFLGYCLVFGQMSYWGIQVILNVLTLIDSLISYIFIFFNFIFSPFFILNNFTPNFGSYLVDFIFGSSSLILYRFFILHFGLSFILLFLICFHIYLLHSFISSNPILNISSSFIISFSLLIIKDFYLFILFYFSFIIFILLFNFEFLSNPVNNILANPLSTPLHILPESYFLIFYCLLRCLPSKILGVIIILCFFYWIFIGNDGILNKVYSNILPSSI